MKNSFLIILLVSAWTVCNSASGEGANLFKLKGASLGMNESEIKKLLPTAVCDTNQSLPKAGIAIYEVSDDENPPSKSTFTFLDGVLIRVKAIYSQKDLAKIGGFKTLTERLTEKLGTPNQSNQLLGSVIGGKEQLGDFIWIFKSEDTLYELKAELIDGKTSSTFYAGRSTLCHEFQERRKNKAAVGF